MTISVVIASYNRAGRLRACLMQLARQSFVAGDEVVVADNGSTDETAGMLLEVAAGFPVPLRIVTETRPGKSHAINSALGLCSGDILAFTDDDVVVADDWIAAIRRTMADGTVGLTGGRVRPIFEGRVPAWLALRNGASFGRLASPLALMDYGDAPLLLGPRTLLGANLAVRREAFEAVGGYPTDLGKLRGTLLSGEDHELCERIQAAGFTATYEPSIAVQHFVPRDRLRLAYFVRWFYWSGVTHATLDRSRPAPGVRMLGVPRYLFKRLLASAARGAAALLRSSWSVAADEATRTAFVVGYVSGTWRPRPTDRCPSPAVTRRAEPA